LVAGSSPVSRCEFGLQSTNAVQLNAVAKFNIPCFRRKYGITLKEKVDGLQIPSIAKVDAAAELPAPLFGEKRGTSRVFV